jgi:ParB family chromosome partitioning protein
MNKPPENPRKALGKGLAALLPGRPVTPPVQAPPVETEPQKPAHAYLLGIDSIDANPLQPRTVFQPERLRELALSIEANGIIQPLIVRPKGDRYELIAGERRWRAAKIAGLSEVPVVVQETGNDHLLEVSLIENIQREDLNPIEIAQAYDRLHREHGLTHDDIAKRTGKDRTSVTNTLRLLKLPPDVQLLLAEHRLSMGHARALLGLPDADSQRQLAEKTAAQGLSVRQVERTVQQMTEKRDQEPKEEPKQDPNVRAAVEELERLLGTRVRIVEKNETRGRIEIEYYSPDDLSRICDTIVGEEKKN